jgi:hypothetical protein
MTIQAIDIEYKNKKYQVILEDGMVSFVDPDCPQIRENAIQPSGYKITSLEGAKRVALQMIERKCCDSRVVEN